MPEGKLKQKMNNGKAKLKAGKIAIKMAYQRKKQLPYFSELSVLILVVCYVCICLIGLVMVAFINIPTRSDAVEIPLGCWFWTGNQTCAVNPYSNDIFGTTNGVPKKPNGTAKKCYNVSKPMTTKFKAEEGKNSTIDLSAVLDGNIKTDFGIQKNVLIKFPELKTIKDISVVPELALKISNSEGVYFSDVKIEVMNGASNDTTECYTHPLSDGKKELLVGPLKMDCNMETKGVYFKGGSIKLKEIIFNFEYKATASSGLNVTKFALDGNKTTLFSTDTEDYPYFELDLGKEKSIKGIKLHFKDGWKEDKFSGVSIRVGNQKILGKNCSQEITHNSLCKEFNSGTNGQSDVEILCDTTKTGRFITLTSSKKASSMKFNEIQALEENILSSSIDGTNLPSNVLILNDPSKYFLSNSESKPWLLVDMLAVNKVKQVSLQMREMNQVENFKDIEVRVGMQMISSNNDGLTINNPLCGVKYPGPQTQVKKHEFACNGLLGKYIVVQRNSSGILRIDDLEITTDLIAIGSSTDKNVINLVDGDPSTQFTTESLQYPFFQIYIGFYSKTIKGIRIQNAADFEDINIHIGMSKQMYRAKYMVYKGKSLCKKYTGTTTISDSTINCDTPIFGNIIHFQKVSSNVLLTITVGEISIVT